MTRIQVLPDVLASQVAAGEVVERPASVVKELVENSIDAGAREVRVDIERGGAGLIRVSDDGSGMSREDALMSLERFATSKLRNSADLTRILTFGFRGEAVPSIASVSRFRLITREVGAESGVEISVDGGVISPVKVAGCAPGTTIEVRNLFYNIPARRKFLRAESTESAHIEHQLRLHALAAPHVRLRFRKDDKRVFDFAAAATPLERVRQLLGPELGRELVPLPRRGARQTSIEGFVLPAKHARKGRRHQFVFLNGRPIEDGVISRALAEGFRGALPGGHYPSAWLWIDLDPALVDVNVHPAKREIRLLRPTDLRDLIVEVVTEAVFPAAPRAEISAHRPATPAPSTASPSARSGAVSSAADPPTFPAPALQPRPEPHLPGGSPHWREALQRQLEIPQEMPPGPEPAGQETSRTATVSTREPVSAVAPVSEISAAPGFRIIGLLQHRYVLLESEDGMVILDPRAAHERIFYESMLAGRDHALEVQGLLVPVLLELDPRDLDLVLRERAALTDAGLEIEGFGGNTLQVRSLPACLPEMDDARSFLVALIDSMLHDAAPQGRFAHERLARILARRAAPLVLPRLAEVPELLGRLYACDLPYCTPDGRPTLTEYSLNELDRRFGVRPQP